MSFRGVLAGVFGGGLASVFGGVLASGQCVQNFLAPVGESFLDADAAAKYEVLVQ